MSSVKKFTISYYDPKKKVYITQDYTKTRYNELKKFYKSQKTKNYYIFSDETEAMEDKARKLKEQEKELRKSSPKDFIFTQEEEDFLEQLGPRNPVFIWDAEKDDGSLKEDQGAYCQSITKMPFPAVSKFKKPTSKNAVDLLKEQSSKYIADLSYEDRDLVKLYSARLYRDMNSCLRDGRDDTCCRTFRCSPRLDQIIQHGPKSEYEITLLRAMPNSETYLKSYFQHMKRGDIFEERAFMSSSYSLMGIEYFIKNNDFFYMKIIVPPGVPMLAIESISLEKEEEEILLSPGMGLKFVGAEKSNDNLDVFIFECAYCLPTNRFFLRDQNKNKWSIHKKDIPILYYRLGIMAVIKDKSTTKTKQTKGKKTKPKYIVLIKPEEFRNLDSKKQNELKSTKSVTAPVIDQIGDNAFIDWPEGNKFRNKYGLSFIDFYITD